MEWKPSSSKRWAYNYCSRSNCSTRCCLPVYGGQVTIKVVTTSGAFMQITGTSSSGGTIYQVTFGTSGGGGGSTTSPSTTQFTLRVNKLQLALLLVLAIRFRVGPLLGRLQLLMRVRLLLLRLLMALAL